MIAFAAVGAALLVAIAVDMLQMVLNPSGRGPLTHRFNRLLWRALRTLPAPSLRLSGLLALAGTFVVWIVGLWLGFALLYLPFMDDLSYAPTVPFGQRGLFEALYVSAVALTTVGFGDVVGGTDALRLVTVLESATGLAATTAAITYLLSSYSATSALRSSAARFADADATTPRGAAELVVHGGTSALSELQRDLLTTEQHLRRFPFLYYLHPGEERRSLLSLLRAAVLVCLVARWVARDDTLPAARAYGAGLKRSLDHLLEALEADFMRVAPRQTAAVEPDAAFRSLRDALSHVAPDAAVPAGAPPHDFARLLGAAEAKLSAYAAAHRYPWTALASG